VTGDKSVFLSSTARDLKDYRDAVYDAIEGLDGFHCVRMENFGARGWEADDFCRAKVAECDLFVGIVGHLYGSCPEGCEQSYTEQEYEAARAAELPCLMFIAPEDFPLPANLWESDEKREKQRAFRQRVSQARIRDTFTSTDDLARRVVAAIRNWEQEQAAQERRPRAARTEGVLPLPPQPYFAHPYPAQEHFTGRDAERADLTAWLADDAHPLLAVIAIGGMGKSALAWHWLHHDLSPLGLDHWDLRGALWWCFYDRESGFERFLERGIAYASGGEMDASRWPVRDRMECLCKLLAERRFLLVLDGAERLLCAYARMDAPYLSDEEAGDDRCADPNVATFLQWLAGLEATKTLLTSRLLPRELGGLEGVARRDLTQMDSEDAVRFFHAAGVQGTRAEIQAACAPYGYLPLALRLLAGLVIEDPARPGDIAVASEYEITEDLKGKEHHHILERAYDALDPAARDLLSRIAAFRAPVGYDALRALFTSAGGWEAFSTERALKDALRGLVRRGLLSRQESGNRYDLHPVVRRYAYDRLADKEGTHTRLRDYFAAMPQPEHVEGLDDLAPTIELYHHTVRAGQIDEARQLYRDRLASPLYYHFGAYQLIIELLRALFPGDEPFAASGEVTLPLLSEGSAQTWTLNALATSYARCGQPGRAAPLVEVFVEMHERGVEEPGPYTVEEWKRDLAIGLGNLADYQLKIGALTVAKENWQRSIALCREVRDKLWEAAGHQGLGRLVAYCGMYKEADREFIKAERLVEDNRHNLGRVFEGRSLSSALAGDTGSALEFANRAYEFQDREQYVWCVVHTEWLLGAAQRARGELAQAQSHLDEALRRCHRINLVETEPDILLELARLRRDQAVGVGAVGAKRASPLPEALSLAREALSIAERCGYRLKQADCHNFLAGLALEEDHLEEAHKHAQTARERAWCDGPPHRYEVAFQEAERLLGEIEEQVKRNA
jgi:tetratricopeptide (TPR) repeat protein